MSATIRSIAFVFAAVGSLATTSAPTPAHSEARATSQTVYVPAYSRILTQDTKSQPLASTLVVHNIDPDVEISVLRLDYHDRSGKLIKSFLDDAVPLVPFESTNALVPIDTVGDGIGANFIVTWRSDTAALSPVIEAIMIGGSGTHGISFTSHGTVISQEP